jgi:hypothetical protein
MFNIRISNALEKLLAEVGQAYGVSRGKIFANTIRRMSSGRIEFTNIENEVNVRSKCGRNVIQMTISEMYYKNNQMVNCSVRDFENLPDGITLKKFRIALAANCLYELEKYTAKDRKEKERIAALDKQYQNGRDYISETPMRVAELRALQGWC